MEQNKEFWNKFFEERDSTGRYMVVSHRTGIRYAIEPIGGHSNWGDVDPSTKKITGSYGDKYKGSIRKEDSMITEENGFKDIITLETGTSPEGYIEWKDSQYPDKAK